MFSLGGNQVAYRKRSSEHSPRMRRMFRDRRVLAKVPLSRDVKRDGKMKEPSVVGRNWWMFIVLVASRRVLAGRERRRASFSFEERVRGIERAVRSSLN